LKTKKENGTLNSDPFVIAKIRATRLANGSNANTLESIAKRLATRRANKLTKTN
jgi:hypothetical protein